MTRLSNEVSDKESAILDDLLTSAARLNDLSNNLWGEVIDAEKSDAYEPYIHDIRNELENYIEPLVAKLKTIEEDE